MALDVVKNFAVGELSIGIDNIATTLTLKSGQGVRFPQTGAYNIVVYNSSDFPDSAEAYWQGQAEIMRVTSITGDTMTVTRAQEGTSAVNFNTSGKTYRVLLAQTEKMISDIDTALSSGGGAMEKIGTDLTAVNGLEIALDFTNYKANVLEFNVTATDQGYGTAPYVEFINGDTKSAVYFWAAKLYWSQYAGSVNGGGYYSKQMKFFSDGSLGYYTYPVQATLKITKSCLDSMYSIDLNAGGQENTSLIHAVYIVRGTTILAGAPLHVRYNDTYTAGGEIRHYGIK